MEENQIITPEITEEPSWLPDRLDRARKQAVRTLLEEIGFADVDALKNTLTEQRQSLEQLVQAQQQAQSQIELAESARQQALIDAAFQGACGQFRFIDPREVRALADFSGVSVTADNVVIGMTEAVEAVAASRPHLLKRTPAPNIDVGQGQPDRDNGLLSPQMVETVKRKFRL